MTVIYYGDLVTTGDDTLYFVSNIVRRDGHEFGRFRECIPVKGGRTAVVDTSYMRKIFQIGAFQSERSGTIAHVWAWWHDGLCRIFAHLRNTTMVKEIGQVKMTPMYHTHEFSYVNAVPGPGASGVSGLCDMVAEMLSKKFKPNTPWKELESANVLR